MTNKIVIKVHRFSNSRAFLTFSKLSAFKITNKCPQNLCVCSLIIQRSSEFLLSP